MAPATRTSVLTFQDARRVVEEHAAGLKPHGRELVSLLDGRGRALAEPIHADRDFPPFARATRDGFAVRAADIASPPATLEVIGEIRAGAKTENQPIGPRQALAIMTGAAVPDEADAVVMLEHTSRNGETVTVQRSVSPGENIVPAGAEANKGELLLAPGTRLDYASIALAASVGRSRLLVHAKPRVAILATGDEIVDLDVTPAANQIRNSNSYSLAVQVEAAGGEPVILPIAPDEPRRLGELLSEGLESDLLLIAGGVSMGKYDLVEQSLAELQAEFFFTGAKIQPGKPIVFGRVPRAAVTLAPDEHSSLTDKYFFGLPGNPISTMVTFELFVKPALQALAGMTPEPFLLTRAELKSAIKIKTGLTRFLPAVLSGECELAEVEVVPWQGSGDLAAVARSNCFVVIAPDRERIEAGEWVPVMRR